MFNKREKGKIKDKNKKISIEQLSDIEDLNVLRNEYEHPKTDLVIGTEEDMYNAILKAERLEKSNTSGKQYYFQASTRSPICPCNEDDYVLYNRIRFVSAKDDSRIVYLYNLRQYDRIIVMANQSEEQSKDMKFAKEVYKKIKPLCNQLFLLPYGE